MAARKKQYATVGRPRKQDKIVRVNSYVRESKAEEFKQAIEPFVKKYADG